MGISGVTSIFATPTWRICPGWAQASRAARIKAKIPQRTNRIIIKSETGTLPDTVAGCQLLTGAGVRLFTRVCGRQALFNLTFFAGRFYSPPTGLNLKSHTQNYEIHFN